VPTYVQGYNTKTWHICRTCSNYPDTIAKRRATRPWTGELCNQCRLKDNQRRIKDSSDECRK
jgi:hypothetical protein